MATKRLKILFLSDDYLPNSTRSHAKMLHELALKFTSIGHKSVVFTPGSITQKKCIDIYSLEGVEVWRFWSINFRRKSKIMRAILETLMPFFALIALTLSRKARDLNIDLCINYSPTIFFAPVAAYLKKKKIYVFLILRDFFPQWAIDQGLLRQNSFLSNFFRYFEKINYKSSSSIAVQSPANISVFKKIYGDPVDLKVLMNWSGESPLSNFGSGCQNKLRAELNLDNYKIVIFYGGNIGVAQDMMNIVRLAKSLKLNKRAHFLLVGQGDEYQLVNSQIETQKLKNLTLLPAVSQEKYREYVACSDIGLFSLAKEHNAHNFPGKLLGYMVEQKPILGSVNIGNDVAQIVSESKAGFVSFNGDDDQFLKDATKLIESEKLRKQMGFNAANLLKTKFTVDAAYETIYHSYLAKRN